MIFVLIFGINFIINHQLQRVVGTCCIIIVFGGKFYIWYIWDFWEGIRKRMMGVDRITFFLFFCVFFSFFLLFLFIFFADRIFFSFILFFFALVFFELLLHLFIFFFFKDSYNFQIILQIIDIKSTMIFGTHTNCFTNNYVLVTFILIIN